MHIRQRIGHRIQGLLRTGGFAMGLDILESLVERLDEGTGDPSRLRRMSDFNRLLPDAMEAAIQVAFSAAKRWCASVTNWTHWSRCCRYSRWLLSHG